VRTSSVAVNDDDDDDDNDNNNKFKLTEPFLTTNKTL
jgi:hypothetical protein